MTGTTPNGIRYPDGASKAKNLGPELQQMAEDIDKFIDDQIDAESPTFKSEAALAVAAQLATTNIVTGIPEVPITKTSRRSTPLTWTDRSISDPWTDTYTDTEQGTWTGSGRFTGDVPILTADGKLPDEQIPAWVPNRSEIPQPTASVVERVARADIPILGARVATAAFTAAPLAIVIAGSSTSQAQPGYISRLTAALQSLLPVAQPSAPVWSASATFAARTIPGVHVYSAGETGTGAANYLTDAECDRIALLNPAAIVHMIGSNDYTAQGSPTTYAANLAARLAYLDTKLTQPCQHILIHAYARMAYTPPTYPHAAYGTAMESVAAGRADTVFWDISGPFRANGIPTGTDPLDLVGPDNIHLTTAGYRFMADILTGLFLA